MGKSDVCSVIGVELDDSVIEAIYLDILSSVGKNSFIVKYGIGVNGEIRMRNDEFHVSLRLYDLSGCVKIALVDDNVRSGDYTLYVDLRDLSSGI